MAVVDVKDPEEEALAALDRHDWNAALTTLMTAYGTQIYRHCRHVLADDTAADELHQLVFVEAYRDLPRFERRSRLRTWLYGIARHRCLDALRVRRRDASRFETGATVTERVDDGPDGAAHVEAQALRAALAASLATLPPESRVAVLLRFEEGLSYEEMSTICDERPATLQARVARALPVMRRWLEAHGVAP